MRTLLLLALVALSPSCGGRSVYVFSGTTIEDGSLQFRVEGAKEKFLILAMRADHGFAVALPYAEDWVFEPTDAKPVSGKSSSCRLFVTVQKHRPAEKVDEERYLKEEYLKNLQTAAERRGSPLRNAAVTKQGEHFVLEYVNEGTLPDGTTFEQTHFWTFRQRDDGVIYEAHLSTVEQDPSKRLPLSVALRRLLGTRFVVMPVEEK